MRFLLKILQPNRILFQDHVERVQVPSVDGVYELLLDHAPIFLALHAGALVVGQAGEFERWFVTGGTCYMKNNECVVLVRDTLDMDALKISELEKKLSDGNDTVSSEQRQLLEAQIAYKGQE